MSDDAKRGVRGSADEAPSVDEILKQSRWDKRLEAARAQRERVLAERRASGKISPPLPAKPWEDRDQADPSVDRPATAESRRRDQIAKRSAVVGPPAALSARDKRDAANVPFRPGSDASPGSGDQPLVLVENAGSAAARKPRPAPGDSDEGRGAGAITSPATDPSPASEADPAPKPLQPRSEPVRMPASERPKADRRYRGAVALVIGFALGAGLAVGALYLTDRGQVAGVPATAETGTSLPEDGSDDAGDVASQSVSAPEAVPSDGSDTPPALAAPEEVPDLAEVATTDTPEPPPALDTAAAEVDAAVAPDAPEALAALSPEPGAGDASPPVLGAGQADRNPTETTDVAAVAVAPPGPDLPQPDLSAIDQGPATPPLPDAGRSDVAAGGVGADGAVAGRAAPRALVIPSDPATSATLVQAAQRAPLLPRDAGQGADARASVRLPAGDVRVALNPPAVRTLALAQTPDALLPGVPGPFTAPRAALDTGTLPATGPGPAPDEAGLALGAVDDVPLRSRVGSVPAIPALVAAPGARIDAAISGAPPAPLPIVPEPAQEPEPEPEPSPAVDRVLVHLLIPGELEAGRVSLFSDAIGSLGYELNTPAPVGVTIRQTQIRYYHEADVAAARLIAERVGGPARDFTGFSPSPPLGTIEVWLEGEVAPPPAPPRQTAPRRQAAPPPPQPQGFCFRGEPGQPGAMRVPIVDGRCAWP